MHTFQVLTSKLIPTHSPQLQTHLPIVSTTAKQTFLTGYPTGSPNLLFFSYDPSHLLALWNSQVNSSVKPSWASTSPSPPLSPNSHLLTLPTALPVLFYIIHSSLSNMSPSHLQSTSPSANEWFLKNINVIHWLVYKALSSSPLPGQEELEQLSRLLIIWPSGCLLFRKKKVRNFQKRLRQTRL